MSVAIRTSVALDEAVRALNADPSSAEALHQLREALRAGGAPDPAEPVDRLVIYGTLAPGRPNHHVVSGIEGRWFKGWVEGDLYDHGWGATEGYPAMLWRPGGEHIEVDVLESAELSRHWERLDEFEGDGYRRLLIPVSREGEPPTVGQIYAARMDEDTADWRRRPPNR